MKTILAALVLLMSTQSFAAPASSLEGTYTVVKGCKANNSRLAALDLLYFPGTEVVIETNQADGFLLISAEHNTARLPFSSDTSLKSVYFKDYYSDADIRVTQNSYAMRTEGSEWKWCGQFPLPTKYPCLGKWDDAVAMLANANGQLQIEWKVEDATGACLLERKN